MKRAPIRFFLTTAIVFLATVAFAGTINWDFYTPDLKHHLRLEGTTWASMTDGERIYFTDLREGVFENGKRFEWIPCNNYNGMSACPDYPTSMNINYNGKQINTLRLRWKTLNSPTLLVDQRGVTYRRVD